MSVVLPVVVVVEQRQLGAGYFFVHVKDVSVLLIIGRVVKAK